MVGVGDTLNNRYQLLALEGEGGMASVYKAQDLKLKRTVAIKVLRAGEEANEAFQQEAQAAANMPHSNIVAVYDIGQDRDASYIVMEYVRGQTLQELIQSEAPFRVGRALDITIQICAAVEFIHNQGIIHCDLKPLNVLVLDNDRVKIADFGIARHLATASPTQRSQAWGTPHYAAPEMISGKPIAPAADIYAIGIILYEMLSGARPFEGKNAADIARQQVLNAPPPIQQHNPRVPNYVCQVLDRALAKEPGKRYRTAGQLSKVLTTYRQHGDAITQPLPAVTEMPATADQQTARPPTSATAGAIAATTTVAAPATQARPRFDWAMLLLGVIAFMAVMGLAPLWNTALTRAFTPPTPAPTSTPTITITPPLVKTETANEPTPALPTPTLTPQEQVAVPELVGKALEEAQRLTQESRLRLAVLDQQPSLVVSETLIISQTIAAGQQVVPQTEIGVVISLGPPTVTMPIAIGFPAAIKQLDLQDLGLTVTITEAWSTEPKGLVISQTPPAGEQVRAGSMVTLTASSGPRGEVRANLDYKVTLVSCEFNDTTFRPGDTLQLDIAWEVLGYLGQDYTLFIHITHQDGRILTQRDEPPMRDRPTMSWQPGEILKETHALSLPGNAPAGSYWVRIGLYQGDRRMTVVDPGLAQTQDNALIIGPFEIR